VQEESRTVQAVPGRTAVAEDTLEVGPAGIPAVGSPGEDDLVGVALPSLLAAAVDIGLLVVVHILQEEGQVSSPAGEDIRPVAGCNMTFPRVVCLYTN
jgi:hypothetical protein